MANDLTDLLATIVGVALGIPLGVWMFLKYEAWADEREFRRAALEVRPRIGILVAAHFYFVLGLDDVGRVHDEVVGSRRRRPQIGQAKGQCD